MRELAERRADAIVAIMRCSESALTAVEGALARHHRVDLRSPGNQGADMSQDEQAFYENGDIRITAKRVQVGSTTYAMSGVTSVTSIVERGGALLPLLSMLVGVFFALCCGLPMSRNDPGGYVLIAVAGLLAVGSFAWIIKATSTKTYVVVLRTSGGEARALVTRDQALAASVVSAINDAIVTRA